jgi:hypothetical protein
MSRQIQFAKDDQNHFALAGGLDLLTPPISVQPGRASGAQNYEPEISGGYRRIDGYERYDGRTAPSAASYSLATIVAGAAAATVGATVTGATSGATARVLGLALPDLVIGRVVGNFVTGESLTIGGTAIGTLASPLRQNGALMPSDHADYLLLAANDLRQNIGQVPGSGPIRGVWVYRDVVYAFRDSADGTQGLIYKATASGWTAVALGYEVQFSNATGQINAGDALGNSASPTVSATVLTAVLRTGTWTTAGAGTLIITAPAGGSFANGGGLFVGGTQKATAAAASRAITRLPGGRLEAVNANFTGSTDTKKMYGVDGVNTAFEFDGTRYVPIRTGMAADAPTHITEHKNYLFLSFFGSVQYSGIGSPYAWSAILGAGELGTGDPVTGFMPAAGSALGDASLAIFTRGKTFILYGSSNQSFKLTPSKFDLGVAAYTAQAVSNDIYGLTARGVQALTTTLDYGDFDYASISHQVQPLLSAKRGLETASTTLKGRNQYRLYFSDGTALVVGLTGQKVSGILPLYYGRTVRCMTTAEMSDGRELTFFGSDDGYIYQDNVGTSFDGQPIEAWLRLHFNSMGSPMLRKRFRRAVLEVLVASYSKVNISYDLGYGTPAIEVPAATPDRSLSGAGGYWDAFTWDQFNWDAQVVNNPTMSLEGTENNISFTFYSNRAQDASHTLQGLTLVTSPRRLSR